MKKRKGKKTKTEKNHVPKFIYWTPRILSILFLLFLAMFSLDIFGNNYTFWETVLGLFMHNIPVFILAILLIIAWKHEWVGALAFILGGLLYISRLIITAIMNSFEWFMISWSLIIAGPAFAVGILFWINWKIKRKHQNKSKRKLKKRS